jgi:outer membrane protein TolC
MIILTLWCWISGEAQAALPFKDLADYFFTSSDQTLVVEQDRDRLSQEYALAVGTLYDPTLKASFFNQFQGYYLNRRMDVSLLQRTSLWGTQFMVGYRNGNGAFPIYDGKWITQDKGEIRFGLEIPLLRNGWIDPFRGAVQKGEWSIELSKVQEKAQKLDLLKQLGARYWEWYTNGNRLRVADELLKLSLDRQIKIKTRVESGDIAKIEQIEGDRIILQRKATRAQQERNFVKSQLDLDSFITSIKSQASLKLGIDEVPDYPYPDLTVLKTIKMPEAAGTEINHPESLRQSILMRQTEVDRDVARNQFLPKLDLSLNLSKDMGTPMNTLYPAQNEAGMTFEFPLPSRAAQARKSQANTAVIRQEAQLDLTRVRIRNQIEETKVTLNLAIERMILAADELQLAKNLVQMENRKFLNGDSNLITLNIREQNLTEAEIRKVEAYAEYRRSLNDFNVARGELNWSETIK